MPLIELETTIAAPAERVFDLSLSVDLHLASAEDTGERVVGGKTSGLLGDGDSITWQARHFGIAFRLQSLVSEVNRPQRFLSIMQKGPFRSIRHEHLFSEREGVTIMTDRFYFEAPMGLLGRIAEKIALTRHMKTFLEKRNALIKQVAEGEQWKTYLDRRNFS